MPQSAFEHVEPEVHQFIARLYESSAMRYAINHSQMEVWVALEGLEHFSHRGWSSWETMGFITGKAVRPKKGTEHSIKFPDLICVRDDLCLWWEFKAIGTRTLRPDKSGGTFVKDVWALCEFDLKRTLEYLNGDVSKARSRDDSAWIGASGLRRKIHAAKEHIGVALIFAPGDDVLDCRNPEVRERQWSPAKRIRDLRGEVAKIQAVGRIREISSVGTHSRNGPGGALAGDGSISGVGAPEECAVPQWAGWIVSMAGVGRQNNVSSA